MRQRATSQESASERASVVICHVNSMKCKGKKERAQETLANQVYAPKGEKTPRVRFQTPSSVSFLGLTECRGANSVGSFRPIICVPKRTHRVFSQNSPSLPQNSVKLSEFSSPKQCSQKCPLKWLGFICPVFTCSVPQPSLPTGLRCPKLALL